MKETFNNLKRVYLYGKEYKKNLLIFTFISILNIIINIIFPVLTARQLVALSTGVYMEIFIATLLIFGMSVVCDFTKVILRKNTQLFFRGTTKAIQTKALKEVIRIELKSIDENGSGTFIQRIGNDTDEMSRVFTRGMNYVTNILTSIGVFVAIFIVSRVIFCFFLISSLLLTLLHLLKVQKLNKKDKIYRIQKEKTNSLIGELIRGLRDIKMLFAKNSFIEKIEKNIDQLTKSQFAFRNTEMNFNFLIGFVRETCELLLMCLFIFMLTKNYITVASALVLYNYRTRVFINLMEGIGNLLQELKSFNLSCERVFALLDNNVFPKESFGIQHLERINGNFEFQEVYFSYGKKEVLKNLTFKIKENETVAFVGKSGTGKTTIFSLLCKLYNINSGKILIDGNNINLLDEESIRSNITVISQNPYIFNMSIKDNFKLVKKEVTDEEIIEACRLACLKDYIETLPNKYDTVVGEGGVTLSGGQRQRLAIARAFIQDTKIILFDEATSALDNETQKYISEAINNMKDKYTILIIAHRLSTIIHSDKIMLLENGKIIETGTHQELLTTSKTYQKLYETEILNIN